MFPVSDLRAYLSGAWRVTREIDDRRAGQHDAFTGTAHFRADGDDLVYEETGTLQLGGYEGEAARVYRYCFPQRCDQADVQFDDGLPFHQLTLTNGSWSGVHLCDPDTYDGMVTTVGLDSWRSLWTVVGPRKDMELVTLFERKK